MPDCAGIYLPRYSDSETTGREDGVIAMRADLPPVRWFKTFVHEVRHWMQDTGGLLDAGYTLGLTPDQQRDTVEADAREYADRAVTRGAEAGLLDSRFLPADLPTIG